jgi:hypothetical protein
MNCRLKFERTLGVDFVVEKYGQEGEEACSWKGGRYNS